MPQTQSQNNSMQASFSMLIMSIASSAAVSLGLSADESGQIKKDLGMARFNIDLLLILQAKTKNNLTPDEQQFLSSVVQDLQTKFIQQK